MWLLVVVFCAEVMSSCALLSLQLFHRLVVALCLFLSPITNTSFQEDFFIAMFLSVVSRWHANQCHICARVLFPLVPLINVLPGFLVPNFRWAEVSGICYCSFVENSYWLSGQSANLNWVWLSSHGCQLSSGGTYLHANPALPLSHCLWGVCKMYRWNANTARPL